MRLEVYYNPRYTDGRARRLLASLARATGGKVRDLRIVDVFIVEGIPALGAGAAREIFCDPVAQELVVDSSAAGGALSGWDTLVEVTAKPGVTDPVAITARDALANSLGAGLPPESLVQTGTQYLVSLAAADAISAEGLAGMFHNPLIQAASCITRAGWDQGARPPARYPHEVAASPAVVARFDLAAMRDDDLTALSKSRLLALSLAEMKCVRAYYEAADVRAERAARGLSAEATDVELEMIAQTWSEHCKHKIFNATIRYVEGDREETIDSLFHTFIRRTTEDISRKRRFLRSVFHDNSGVIAFDRDTLVCFKVETHNSPSALDPYGGAITGIVGVNRDIMGTGKGAKPIFNTDVLCFGMPDTPPEMVPAGLLDPRRVFEGVHRGIVDGGNQSGIPVVAGAILFDESYLGKPLVFCGTGGVLPARVRGEPGWTKRVTPGELAVMVGGRIGKDGIHGATFSSEALSETSPTSAVQIGDPITQKKMLDMLLEARDLGLYDGITDNGAGGLSSSLGEMATLCGGVRIDLDRCPLKYRGLAAWEILVSESQERMSLAVPPARVDAFLALAARRDVEATVVGEFTDTGFVEVLSGGSLVGLLRLSFLHEGLPVMDLRAEWKPPIQGWRGSAAPAAGPGATLGSFRGPALRRALAAILSDPTVASKEEWVRQYDHEVQARSVVKPFVGRGRDAPSDGAVLRLRPQTPRGITVTHGICPWYGDRDTYDMAQCAVDEAVRAHVALGGDPQQMSALDNFCWPDPIEGPDNPDGAYKLAQLVRACRGLADACRAYMLPLISGKDSMKNDARVGGKKISIRPTLLVSLLGIVPDVRRAVTSDFKGQGDAIYLVGETRGELGCTRFERVAGSPLGTCPSVKLAEAYASYQRVYRAIRTGLVRSCHDLSDGGLWVALAESCIGGECGAAVSLDRAVIAGEVGDPDERALRLLVSETPSRLLVSVSPSREKRWRRLMRGSPIARIGETTGDGGLRITQGGAEVSVFSLAELRASWAGQASGEAV